MQTLIIKLSTSASNINHILLYLLVSHDQYTPHIANHIQHTSGKKGKTKIPLPICTLVDGPRAKDGGPPPEYVARHNHYTDLGRFSRDNPPEHPLQDDSGWLILYYQIV